MSQPSDYNSFSPSGSDVHNAVIATVQNVLILSSSLSRAHASIFNHSPATLHLKFGQSSSLGAFDVKLTSASYYELPKPVYLGPIYGTWDAAGGWAFTLELGKSG